MGRVKTLKAKKICILGLVFLVVLLHFINRPRVIVLEKQQAGKNTTHIAENPLSPSDFIVNRLDSNEIQFINSFGAGTKSSYAWYIIDNEGSNIVTKTEYSLLNSYTYHFQNKGSFKIRGYIKTVDNARFCIDFATVIIMDNGEVQLELVEGVKENIITDIIKDTHDIGYFSEDNISVYQDGMAITCINDFNADIFTFAWYVVDNRKNTIEYKGTYSKNNIFKYTFDKTGEYTISSYVMNQTTKERTHKNVLWVNVDMDKNLCTIDTKDIGTHIVDDIQQALPLDPDEVYTFTADDVAIERAGNNMIFTNNYSKENTRLEYAWCILDENSQKTFVKREYEVNPEFNYTFAENGVYAVYAYVRNSLADLQKGINIVRINVEENGEICELIQ